ncbi:hypothetical protein [Streptomyces sp. NPDC015345]|uniref:hypothetical protein n=1 Tax=Streptomyces sp. NPDC015345 TaxID=3364953 RepID=UPI0036F8F2D5
MDNDDAPAPGGRALAPLKEPEPVTGGSRSRAERRRDTGHRLAHDVDAWVTGASADGVPHLVPLSFDWDGEAMWPATPADGPAGRAASRPGARSTTGRDLMRGGRWAA